MDLLDKLSNDTLPEEVVNNFVQWCVWNQAYPALITVLEKTGLTDLASEARTIYGDISAFIKMSETAEKHAQEARRQTGPLGLSTAEATAFLVNKLAKASQEENIDAEEISFYCIQAFGWLGFAESNFEDPKQKAAYEQQGAEQQEAQLQVLMDNHHG